MTENRKKILEMLAEKKISVDEAYRLLNAIGSEEDNQESTSGTATAVKNTPKYLRVTVLPDAEHADSKDIDRVNVRVPMSLIRSGIKLTSLIPNEARDKVNVALLEKGIDFNINDMKPEDIETLIDSLSDLQVDVVTAKGETVKVFVE